MSVRPYVLCGGSGTRLWPLSTPRRPKPLLQLPGQPTTLLQLTLNRLRELGTAEAVLVCGAAHEAAIGREAPGLRRMVEPVARGTAAAIVAAALHARQEGPGPMLVVPSDHVVANVAAFSDAVRRGLPAAEAGELVLIGVEPTEPATGYGWIERSEGDPSAAVPVRRFVEKPDRVRAERLLAAGGFLWNGGMVLASPETVIREARRHAPDVLLAVERAFAGAESRGDATWLDGDALRHGPSVSFDVGVLERSDRVAVVGAAMGWSDVGSWDAVLDAAGADADGGVTVGDVVATDCSGSLLVQQGPRPVAAAGLQDTVVVSAEEGVLVVSRGATQAVGALAREFLGRIQRPWGDYEVLDRGPGYALKRLRVDPGQRTSLQRHRDRAERWTVVQGLAHVHLDGEATSLSVGQSIEVPRGAVHRLACGGHEPLVVVEVQLGERLAEDDIERFDDDYGRA